jgi:hypothetical protein
VRAPAGLADAKHIEFVSAFAEARIVRELLTVCHRLQSFHAAYALANDIQVMTTDVVRFIRMELQRRAAVAA